MRLSSCSTILLALVLAFTGASCSKNATVPVDRSSGSQQDGGTNEQRPQGDDKQNPNCPLRLVGGVYKPVCTDGGGPINNNPNNDGKPGKDGQDGADGEDGEDGKPCLASYSEDKKLLTVTCPSQEPVVIPIKDGKNGESCKASYEGNILTISCPEQDPLIIPIENGKDAEPCQTIVNETGVYLQCPEQEAVKVSCETLEMDDDVYIKCPGQQPKKINGEDGAPGEPGKPGTSTDSCQESVLPASIISRRMEIAPSELEYLTLPYRKDAENIKTVALSYFGDSFGIDHIKDTQVVFALELTLPNRKYVKDVVTSQYMMQAVKVSDENTRHKDTELLCFLNSNVCSGNFIHAEPFSRSNNAGLFDVRSQDYSKSLIEKDFQEKGGYRIYKNDAMSMDLREMFKTSSQEELLDIIYQNVTAEQANATYIKTKIYVAVADDTYVVNPKLHLELELNTCDMDQGTQTGYDDTFNDGTTVSEDTVQGGKDGEEEKEEDEGQKQIADDATFDLIVQGLLEDIVVEEAK